MPRRLLTGTSASSLLLTFLSPRTLSGSGQTRISCTDAFSCILGVTVTHPCRGPQRSRPGRCCTPHRTGVSEYASPSLKKHSATPKHARSTHEWRDDGPSVPVDKRIPFLTCQKLRLRHTSTADPSIPTVRVDWYLTERGVSHTKRHSLILG